MESLGGNPPEASRGFMASMTTLPAKRSVPASAIACSAAFPRTASTSRSPCAAVSENVPASMPAPSPDSHSPSSGFPGSRDPIITSCPLLEKPAASRRPTSPVPSTPTRVGANRPFDMVCSSLSTCCQSRPRKPLRRPAAAASCRRPGSARAYASVEVRAERGARDEEAALDEVVGLLEGPVLVLDRDDAVVADPVELREEAVPSHLAESWEAWDLPAHAERDDAVAVEAVAVDLHVLRVDVEEPRGVVADDALVVDPEPNEMGRVEVEAEAGRRDDREHLVPDGRCRGQVGAAGPLVPAEDHRAVLDRDAHAFPFGVRDEPRPHLPELAEVVRDVLRRVAPDERADRGHAEPRRCVHHLPQVGIRVAPFARVGMEVVRVVGERGDLEPVPVEDVAHLAHVEPGDVDVRDPGVAAALASRRGPARDLEHLEPVGGRPRRDALETHAREGSRQETKLQAGTSTQRRSALDRAIASPRTLAQCPSAKVG